MGSKPTPATTIDVAKLARQHRNVLTQMEKLKSALNDLQAVLPPLEARKKL
jgi:hypothetical protein